MNEELKSLEDTLKSLKPDGLNPDLLHRLDTAMSQWQKAIPAEEKIIHFEQTSARPSFEKMRNIGVAAAVVAVGAVTALMVSPRGGQSPVTVDAPKTPSLDLNQIKAVPFDPLNVNVENTSSQRISISLDNWQRPRLQDNTGTVITLDRPIRNVSFSKN